MPTLIRVTPREPSATLRCAYCHGPAEEECLERCEICGALLHLECGRALGRCTTLGCAPRAATSEHAAEPKALAVLLLFWLALCLAVGAVGAVWVQASLGH